MGPLRSHVILGSIIVLLVIFTGSLSHGSSSDGESKEFPTMNKVFSGSPPLMHSLAGKEEVIYIIMKDFQKELLNLSKSEKSSESEKEKRLELLEEVESYLKDFEETTGRVRGNYVVQKPKFRASEVVWNPLASYHMIRRFANELKTLVQAMDVEDEAHQRTRNHILSIMKDFGWPSEVDLKNHMDAILRVQNVYNLNTTEVSKGKIVDQETQVGLTGTDCHEIGKVGLRNHQYTWGLEWLEVAAEKMMDEKSPRLPLVEHDMTQAILAHDLAWERSAGWEHQYFINRVSEVPKDRVKRRNIQFQSYKGGKTPNLNEINFWGLCDGENYQDPEDKKKLFCYLEKEINNKAWTLSPIKVEILSLHPLIIQYYDVLGDRMIEKIKKEAEPLLSRSTVIDESNGGRKMTSQRTSLSGWIPEVLKKEFSPIPRSIELITGLKTVHVSAAEELQVASYAFGGHYEVHMDALRLNQETLDRGDRIATFMFYLTDVEKGGSTAFPIAGVAARPVKGSAVYWNNLFSSGEPDERTWHGACPVIMGEKWVANKWIRMFDQFKSHKCHPNSEKKVRPVDFQVNGKNLALKRPVRSKQPLPAVPAQRRRR